MNCENLTLYVHLSTALGSDARAAFDGVERVSRRYFDL